MDTLQSRRRLMKFLASSACAAALPDNVFTAIVPPRIRWAQGFLLWRNYKGATLTLRDAVGDLAAVKADGIEFSPLSGELEKQGLNAASLKQLLADKKLAIAGSYFSAPFYDAAKREVILQDALQRFVMMKEYDVKNMIIGPPAFAHDSPERNAMIRAQASLLNDIGKRAVDQGLQIGLHPHLNTLVETPAEIDLALATTDPKYVFLSADTGHIHLAGGDVVPILTKHKARLNYFHFKDGLRPFVRPNFQRNLRELGRGEIDFPGVMRLLKEIQFTGWINIEQDATLLTPQASCSISMAYVNRVLKPIYS
jgi:inosose dehydratase